jgi:hypothetical protein
MRVSVVNFCSTAVDMLDFSTRSLFENAGTTDFDYFLVTWLPTPEVLAWCDRSPYPVTRIPHDTVPGLAYVPQLRAMMNHGFDIGYAAHDWVAIVNTDMAFGRDWLLNLERRATERAIIPNSVHITPTPAGYPPAQGVGIHQGNFGEPTAATFDSSRFWSLHDALYRDQEWTHGTAPGGWESCATFPYLLHRSWWERCGPWSPEHTGGEAPDRRFFRRCYDAGAKFVLVGNSIVYHHEAVERKRSRPPGAEALEQGT